MKQTKKKKIFMAAGLAAGITVLASAALANFSTANGYETYKKAVMGLMGQDNYTMEVNFKLALDGNTFTETHTFEQCDQNGENQLLRISEEKGTANPLDTGKDMSYYDEEHVQDGGKSYSISESDFTDTGKNTYGNYYDHSRLYPNDTVGSLGADYSDETSKKIMRVAELAADTFVGDLKNNIVYVGGDDTQSTYEMNLDYVQIPEIVNAGLSAIFSMEYSNSQMIGSSDPLVNLMGTDPIISSAGMTFSVDNEGRLLSNEISGVMKGTGLDGASHEIVLTASLVMSDYGTTTVERFDPSTMPENTTYYDVDAQQGYNVKFDSDGNIISKELRDPALG